MSVMHAPSNANFRELKRVLRYVKGTVDLGMHIHSNSSSNLYAFANVDWACCPLTRRSTTGYCTFLGSNCISWRAKKQPTVARSSTEAEYHAMASAAAELTWLSFILRDIGVSLIEPPHLFCDNLSALHLTVNLVFHSRTKHIQLDFHFVREKSCSRCFDYLLCSFLGPACRLIHEAIATYCLLSSMEQTWSECSHAKFEGG